MAEENNIYDEIISVVGELTAEYTEECARRYFELAAKIFETDEPSGAFYLGQAYYFGYGTEEDNERAFEYFAQAEKAGVVPACRFLAEMYLNATFVDYNSAKAYALLREGAENGDTDCKTAILAQFFTKEERLPWERDNTKTPLTDADIEEWEARAKSGSDLASFMLAKYYLGKGDKQKALEFAKTAAAGQFYLAEDIIGEIQDEQNNAMWREIDGIYEEINQNNAFWDADGKEFNAVLIPSDTAQKAKPVHIEDFATSALAGAIGAAETALVQTGKLHRLSDIILFAEFTDAWNLDNEFHDIVAFYDKYGGEKRMPANERIYKISGKRDVYGDCIVCAYKDKAYIPLTPVVAANFAEWLNRDGIVLKDK